SSRGAPIHVPFTMLPDRLYRSRRYAEARELYRQLADSHPDREEGLLASYKAGLCSTELKDTQAAFGEFTRLEGTMYDHPCALGMANVGVLDGNIEWAWTALKAAYRQERPAEIKAEVWFALLGLVESLKKEQSAEKARLLREILTDVRPDPEEMGQVTFE